MKYFVTEKSEAVSHIQTFRLDELCCGEVCASQLVPLQHKPGEGDDDLE